MDVGLKGRACDGISSLDDDSYDASHDSRRRTTERDSSSVDGRRVMGQAGRDAPKNKLVYVSNSSPTSWFAFAVRVCNLNKLAKFCD